MLLMHHHPHQPQLIVAAAILDDLDKPTRLLTAVRSYPTELAGQVELPGGKVEPGEDPIAALHREIYEELGADLELGEELLPPAPLAVAYEPITHEPTVLELMTHEPSACAQHPTWPLSDTLVMRVWFAEFAPTSKQPQAGPAHRSITFTPLNELTALPWLPADIAIATYIADLLSERS